MANAINNVQFDAGRAVNGVAFNGVRADPDGYNGQQVPVHPGQPAPVNPAVNPPVNNDGARARHMVPVRLPKRDGTLKIYELSVMRVNADGSLGSLDTQYDYADLVRRAARIEALALAGVLFTGVDLNDVRSIRFDLHRGDRRHAFTLRQACYTPHAGNRTDVDFNDFIQGRQAALAALGQELAEADNKRREDQERLRHHGEHPAQQQARQP